MRLGTALSALLALSFSAPVLADGVVGVAPADYRLVGEDQPSPQKARMVEEQVAAGIVEAGRVPEREDVPEGVPVVRVAVEESGALYEFTVEIPGGEREQGRFTGPFAGMLGEVRRTVRRLVEEHRDPAAEPPPLAEQEDAGEDAAPPAEAGTERNPLWIGSLALTAAGGAALIAGIVLFFVDDPCVDETEFGCKEFLDTTVPAIPLAGLGGIATGVGIAGLVSLEPTRPSSGGTARRDEARRISAGISRARGGAVAGLSLRF